jgi:hypothetical protein
MLAYLQELQQVVCMATNPEQLVQGIDSDLWQSRQGTWQRSSQDNTLLLEQYSTVQSSTS